MQEIRANKSFVDNSKVSDHHAIIPTEQYVQLEHMSSDERKIYDLVVRRFLAVLSPACEYEETSITGTMGTEQFHAKGNVILKAGWKEVYEAGWQDMEEDDDMDGSSGFSSDLFAGQDLLSASDPSSAGLSVIREDADLTVTSLRITEGKTKPPAYFTEGTLIAAMENPVKYMEHKNKKLVRTLGETGGLGTVATRADIIEKLFNSFSWKRREMRSTSRPKGASCSPLYLPI